MKIQWLPNGLRSFEAQIVYLAERSPSAALRMGDLIQTAVDRLSGYPESGRPGRVAGTRELVVARTPFIVVYRVERHAVLILRVLHGKQQWPPESGRREASPSDRPPQ